MTTANKRSEYIPVQKRDEVNRKQHWDDPHVNLADKGRVVDVGRVDRDILVAGPARTRHRVDVFMLCLKVSD